MNANVKKCVQILKNAKDDNEKLAGLFMVTKVVDDKDCDIVSRIALFEAIGVDFFIRLLTATTVPEDCPVDTFRSLGLTVLIAFCHDAEIIGHSDFIKTVPLILDTLETALVRANSGEAELAYKLLEIIICHGEGLKTLVSSMAVSTLTRIATNYEFQRDGILKMLILLMKFNKNRTDIDVEDLCKVLNALSLVFFENHNATKFEIMESICAFLALYNSEIEGPTISDHPWPQHLFDGLKDILRSTVDKRLRDRTLKLAAMAVNVLGPNWLMSDKKEPKKIFLMYVHLCSIEVRLAIEDTSLLEILNNAELITTCFVIIESAIYFMASDNVELEHNDILNVYRVLKHTYSNIFATLDKVSRLNNTDNFSEKERSFLCALIKVTISWLTQETAYTNSEIWNILPFILKFINESFVIHCAKTVEDRPDLLRLVLPVLSQLASDEKGRDLILSLGQLDTLYVALCHYCNKYFESVKMLQYESIEIRDIKVALFYLCDIYINIITVETREKINRSFPRIHSIFSFILNNIDFTFNIDIAISIEGCLAILGLVILRQFPDTLVDSFEIRHCVKYVFNFNCSLHVVDEINGTMEIAEPYLNDWPDIIEFWTAGFDALVSLIGYTLWIADLATEDSWPEKLNNKLSRLRPGHIQPDVKHNYERLLCILCEKSECAKLTIKQAKGMKIYQRHKFSTLLRLLNS